jgi:hypothetical protein
LAFFLLGAIFGEFLIQFAIICAFDFMGLAPDPSTSMEFRMHLCKDSDAGTRSTKLIHYQKPDQVSSF